MFSSWAFIAAARFGYLAKVGSDSISTLALLRASSITSVSFITSRNFSELVAPDWAAPSTLPDERRERSYSESLNPSVVEAKASSRWPASDCGCAPVTAMQTAALFPRPTRPRSW